MRRERQVRVALASIAIAATVVALPSIQWTLFTLISLTLLALASLSVWLGRPGPAYLACAGTLAFSSIVCLGYLYGAGPADTVGSITPMTLPAAVAFLFAALTVLSMIPNGLVHWVISGQDAGAILQRRILPVALVVLPGLGFFRRYLEANGRSTDNFALAANITVASAALVAITIQAARRLRGLDTVRRDAEEALRALNRDLAERVRQRSEELERERTRVALLRDRDRIARDLHDRVIQRLFASGLQLTGLQTTLDEPAATRVDGVVTDIDSVIRELRKTIFQLETTRPTDPAEAMSATVGRVGRILGFAPTLTITGDPARLSPDIAAHILAVAHEALSNTIRHAQATHVSVTLDVRDTCAVLRVEDDGKGLPDAVPHRSGLANIDSRARELGGSFRCGRAEPRGTVLVFETPLAKASPVPAPRVS